MASVTIRLSEGERQALDELAGRTRLSRSDVLRLGLAAVVIDLGQVVSFVQAGHGGGEAAPPPAPAPGGRRRRGRR